MERAYLSHVPIAIFLRYPFGYVGSTAYPYCPVVGVNPSFAWRGRKAEAERQDAQQAPSPSGAADHLLALLTRLFSSSSSSADSQTTKLLFSPSKTFIETQLSGQRRREGRKGKCVPYPKTSACHMGDSQVCVPCAPSLIPVLLFFPPTAEEEEVYRSGRVRAPCVFAREFVDDRVHAELLEAVVCSPRTTRMSLRSARRAFMWRNGYSASPQITRRRSEE